MLVLAMDTTSEHGGVAVFHHHECLAAIPHTSSTGYSVTLFRDVEIALAEAGARLSRPHLTLQDIQLFAAATGPGSFTGIRTGLAATQGWAMALRRPVYGVSILAAMIEACGPETGWAASLLDARRGEFYFQLFRRGRETDPDGFEPFGEGMVLKQVSIPIFLKEHLPLGATVTCVIREGDAATLGLRGADNFVWKTAPRSLLGPIARVAMEAQGRGGAQAPAALDACYIRRSDAELNWKL